MSDIPVHLGRAPLPARHRVKGEFHWLPVALAALVSLFVIAPIAVIVAVALSGDGADWPHLARYVLPQAALTTALLLGLVAIFTAIVGVWSAWAVIAYDFPLRRFLSWALVLPFAVPPYLAAYAFAEFFHFVGPVQSALRWAFGFSSPRDYWFPDIRSTWGAALVIGSVTYPYVYLTTRVVFLMQGRNIADVARTLGARPGRVLMRILLPVARPAIAAGLALVLMETLNDIGAVEYLGVQTLTFSIYNTWLNRGSLEGAAQIATVMLFLVFALLSCEQWARRKQRFHTGRDKHAQAHPQRRALSRRAGTAVATSLALPVLFGFGIPLVIFARYSLRRLDQILDPRLLEAFLTSVGVALMTAVVTVLLALLLLNAFRLSRAPATFFLVRLASIGYALPGTILGIGLLLTLSGIDNWFDGLARAHAGVSTGLLLSGTATAVVIACTIRFLALAEGAIRSGLEKLPPSLDQAARCLGSTSHQSAIRILIPLLRPAILTAAILVFVDTVKELSATILLRPFGFSTLATHVYENASRGAVEDAALAALLIIATAMVPVILLSRSLSGDRVG